ncbi:TIP-1 family-domain-containing protein [Parasitella parasitica]|nr:TIP-1 family-domain-containing protein [Parasitella parasitica]
MTTSVDELQCFLSENIKDDKDLNLSRIIQLLKTRKSEQINLDSKLQALEQETKGILFHAADKAKLYGSTLKQLNTLLETTEKDIDIFMVDSAGNTPKANLLEHLTVLENKLKAIDAAKIYIKTLLTEKELSSQALGLVKQEPEKAIIPYKKLVKFEEYISDQARKHEQYSGLAEHLQKSRIRLYEELDAVLTADFKQTLDSLSWPSPIKPPYGPQLGPKLKKFEEAFRNLLMLQKSPENNESSKDDIFSPISIMLEGLSLRFRFHFETSKPTNRIDKPEWYLQHVKNTISTHMPFIMTTIQPLIEAMAKNGQIYAKDQFIRGLLQDVTRKLQNTMPQVLGHPNWLSHTIHQVLEFDKSLQEEFAYDQYNTLSDVILGNSVWFNAWFQAEKSFAQSRYDEILLDSQAFDIYAEDDFEKPQQQQQPNSKPIKRTKSAVRLINLLENITQAYMLVPNLVQKFKFFADIQLNLLGQYQKRLSTAIDSFEALSLIRSVPVPGALPEAVTGVMTATETGGTLSALNRLYRWWTSARSMSDVLKDWTEEELFIDMQFHINQNPDCVQDVSQANGKNSCMVLLPHEHNEGLFSMAITAYEQLNKRAEKIIVKIAVKEWTTETRQYAKKDVWWQTSTETPTEISDELYRPLQDLRVIWNYLYSILPRANFLIVYRQTLGEIESWYWKNIITQSQFSTTGADQLETDLKQGLWKIGQKWVLKPENFMKKLKETIQLLTLPFSSEQSDLPSCNVLMKALADKDQLELVQKTLSKLGIEVLTNGEIRDAAMDDWHYEMRREIQEIVPGLYLGPFSACRHQLESLKKNGITHIVCFVDQNESRLFQFDTISQYFGFEKFIVSDSNLQNLIPYFPDISRFIHNVISQQGKVVVCCNGGMSRSPTFAIAYVMERYNIDASQAYHFVQAKRLCINPNDGFKSQLKEYEPIYKARQNSSFNEEEEGLMKRRRGSGPDDDENGTTTSGRQSSGETKRFYGLEEQQQNGVNANMSAGYSSTLL